MVEVALAAMQSRMAAALLAPDGESQRLPESWFAGARSGADGLRIHRNTVLGALCNALRLSYPAVDRLVGEAFFDRLGVDFARAHPPAAPQLGLYGAGFAAFIDGYAGTDGLPWLGALAAFDWQLDEVARLAAAAGGPGATLALEGGVTLCFAGSLRLHQAQWPVDALREAVLADDVAALRSASALPGTRHYALWRAPEGVRVRELAAPAAAFIASSLQGGDAAGALAAAAAADPTMVDAELAALLARDVLQAGFATSMTGTAPDRNSPP